MSFITQVAETGTEGLGTQPGCSREIALLFAEEIIRSVGQKRTDRIFLVGCGHIELLVELVYHGFTEVTCGAALAGPNAGELAADIFVIPAAERRATRSTRDFDPRVSAGFRGSSSPENDSNALSENDVITID